MYLIHVALWHFVNVMALWKGSESDFNVFLNEFGNNDHNIWLTYNFDKKVTPFFELLISIENNGLSTITYHKETAVNICLQASSHHLGFLSGSIPMGQLLRICRNCTQLEDYRGEMEDMYKRFWERGYPHRIIRKVRKRALDCERSELFSTQDDEDSQASHYENNYMIWGTMGGVEGLFEHPLACLDSLPSAGSNSRSKTPNGS